MSGSRTVYSVQSSTVPIFDDSSRINQFEAAMLDYVANSSIEQSEYIKSYYNSSRLRNYRSYLNWCDKSGFTNIFGKVNSEFYGDATFDNVAIANLIKDSLNLEENDTLGVYQTNLSFFSEDFYLKYLATQQGKASYFYFPGIPYEVSYPSISIIKASLSNGVVIEGNLPTEVRNSRFLEISYSIIKKVIEEVIPPSLPEDEEKEEEDSPEKDPEDSIEPTPIIVTRYVTEYGFYHYREGSGNTALDNLIRNNNITSDKTFFPPVPIRSNTAWFKDSKAKLINDALVFLDIYNKQTNHNEAYASLQTNLIEGMKEGSIDDIDYITLLPSIALNSDNQADLRYLYEFFYNCYFNYALKTSRPDPNIAKSLESGSNYLGAYANLVKEKFKNSGYNEGYFTNFNINCEASNLNLTYSWGHAEYFEHNGKFHPKAKESEYGVLSNDFVHKYSVETQARDEEGNLRWKFIVTSPGGEGNDEGYYAPVMETVIYEVPYSLTAFCHQISESRYRFVLFTSLCLSNLIYANKSINTSASGAINTCALSEDVTISFKQDIGINTDIQSEFVFKRVAVTGENDTGFIVPLEKNTFFEIGYKNQLDIAYGSQYLIFNIWVAQKRRWYQRGFLGKVLAFTGLALALSIVPIMPIIGTALVIYFGTICTAILLEMTLKTFQVIFGDRLGEKIYSSVLSLVKNILVTVGNICRNIPIIGWLIWGICMTAYFFTTSGEYLRQGVYIKDAIKNSMIETSAAAVSGIIASSVGDKVSTALTNSGFGSIANYAGGAVTGFISGSVTGIASSLIQGNSFSNALKTGFKQGLVQSVLSIAFQGISDLFELSGNISGKANSNLIGEIAKENGVGTAIKAAISSSVNKVLTNPNTYVSLLGMVNEERQYHKLANLENDYQEFNNNLKATQNVLDVLMASTCSTNTSEFLCKLQTSLNRTCADPENMMTPDVFLSTATATGSDIIKTVLGSPSYFVENKLTLDGYVPSSLYYTQLDYTTSWDVS